VRSTKPGLKKKKNTQERKKVPLGVGLGGRAKRHQLGLRTSLLRTRADSINLKTYERRATGTRKVSTDGSRQENNRGEGA